MLERQAAPGGKMRRLDVAGRGIDGGPTVLTMRWVLEHIFEDAGATLSEHVTLEPLSTLARHAWGESERLDLHADLGASADAIGRFGDQMHLSPLLYGWLISAFIRVATGSATVAITTASGLLVPVLALHPELSQTHIALIIVARQEERRRIAQRAARMSLVATTRPVRKEK